ncbi:MAG: hypothetical protein ACP5NS_03865 [Candidatus Pacearchaeota archaeon]
MPSSKKPVIVEANPPRDIPYLESRRVGALFAEDARTYAELCVELGVNNPEAILLYESGLADLGYIPAVAPRGYIAPISPSVLSRCSGNLRGTGPLTSADAIARALEERD